MKRILYFASLLLSAGIVSAQNCSNGINSLGFYDEFTSETAPGDSVSGIYFWGEPELAGDDNPEFQAVLARDSVSQELDITITQAQGQYIPIGTSFGGGNGTPTYVMDLTNDASFELIISNKSITAIKCAISLEDSNGNFLNTYSTANPNDFGTAWQHAISVSVDPESTVTYSGDFTGGYNANYDESKLDSSFNFSIVSGITYTITSTLDNGAPNYEPLAIADVALSFESIKVGECSTVSFLEKINSEPLGIFPNPASQSVVVEVPQGVGQHAELSIVSASGQLMNSKQVSPGALHLNTSSFIPGVYMIRIIGNDTMSHSELVIY